MGLLDWLTGRSAQAGELRLSILMDYSLLMISRGLPGATGVAAVDWTGLTSAPTNPRSRNLARIVLASLLYARILVVHEETRLELFTRVGEAATDAADAAWSPRSGALHFRPWNLAVCDPLDTAALGFPLWPWLMVAKQDIEAARSQAAIGNPRTYVATLKMGRPCTVAPAGFLIHLDMPEGFERVFAPASALIALASLSGELDVAMQRQLAGVLLGVNHYYGSPENASMWSEAKAVVAAIESLPQPPVA